MSDPVVIPAEPVPPSRVNPQCLLLYGAPKCGKTTATALLPDSLILEADPSGADYVSARRIDIPDWATLQRVLLHLIALRKAGKPAARRLVVDTISAVEEWLDPVCVEEYKRTVLGKSFQGTSITEMDRGAGYGRTRDKMSELIWQFGQAADEVILLGHLRDRALVREKDEPDRLTAKDIDLVGKVRQLVCSRCSAIGYLRRDAASKLWADFRTTETINCGSRSPHLASREIMISERLPDGTVRTFWDAIYLPKPAATS